MLKNNSAEFSIIASFNRFDGLIFICNYIKCIIKIVFYFILNNRKYRNYLTKLKVFNEFKHNIYGHKALNFSLLRGLKKLQIPFVYNKISKTTKYVILLWVNKRDLKKVEKIKKQKYPHLIIATVPTACQYDYDMTYKFAELDYIDYSLVASKWVKKSVERNIDKKYRKKIVVWPSGVNIKSISRNKEIHNAVLCYYKLQPENPIISQYLKQNKIKPYVLQYGKYKLDEYKNILSKVDFVIFIQDIIESQGLAIAEAWAEDKPTIIQYNKNDFAGETCPYLTNKTGLYYNDIQNLFSIINKYLNNPSEFLNAFAPYDVAKTSFSEEASINHLIKILQSKDSYDE